MVGYSFNCFKKLSYIFFHDTEFSLAQSVEQEKKTWGSEIEVQVENECLGTK